MRINLNYNSKVHKFVDGKLKWENTIIKKTSVSELLVNVYCLMDINKDNTLTLFDD